MFIAKRCSDHVLTPSQFTYSVFGELYYDRDKFFQVYRS